MNLTTDAWIPIVWKDGSARNCEDCWTPSVAAMKSRTSPSVRMNASP